MALTWSPATTISTGYTYSTVPAGIEESRGEHESLIAVEAELEETEAELALVQDKLRRAMILITRMADDENIMPTADEYDEFIAPIMDEDEEEAARGNQG